LCQAINEGSESHAKSSGRFLLREGDDDLEVTGVPALPAPWDDFLLTAPLEGRTIAAFENGSTWIDLGAEHGLRAGMRLFTGTAPLRAEFRHLWGGKESIPHSLEVLDVEKSRSRIGYVQREQAATTLLPLPVGSIVTSREPPRG
jgi:hypothetical protein